MSATSVAQKAAHAAGVAGGFAAPGDASRPARLEVRDSDAPLPAQVQERLYNRSRVGANMEMISLQPGISKPTHIDCWAIGS
jgi:hypothetical protein